MRKYLALFLAILVGVQATPAHAWKTFSGYKEQVTASDIETTTSNFNSNLNSSHNTVQKALDALDDLVSGGVTGTGLAKAVAFWSTSSVLTYATYLFYDSVLGTLNVFTGVGSEKVSNGSFTGNATGWTVGSGYAYSSNTVVHSSNGTAVLSQNISGLNGEYYVATYTISNWTAGTVTPSLGGITGTAVSANGTYTVYFLVTSTAVLAFTPSNTSRFTIDNISVKKYTGGSVRTGSIYTNDLIVSATNSNGSPGTTHHISLKNPSGSYNWIENYFGSTLRSALGFDSSGNILNYVTSGASQFWYSISGGYFSYLSASSFYHQGYAQFGSFVYAGGGGFFGGKVTAGQANTNPPSTLTSYGGTGFKTAYLTSSQTLTDAYTDIDINGDGNNVCTGTATACTTYNGSESTCNSHSAVGCSYFSGYSCSAFNNEYGMGGCSGQSPCSPDTGSCSGGGAYDYSSCVGLNSSYGGSCDWTNSPIDCSTYGDDSSCGGHVGMECTYTSPVSSSCSGTVTSCDTWDGDESSCTSHSLFCSWDGMGDCYNSVTDCSTWNSDETNCGSAGCSYTPGVSGYCTGSIDNYSCTGSGYYTGNCSGNYGAYCAGTAACGNITSSGACAAETPCSWSTGISFTFMSDSGFGTSFYKFYRAINHGSTASAVFYPNTGQTVNGTSSYSLAPGKAATFVFFYHTLTCATWSGTDSSTCTTGHGSDCTWTACSTWNGDESTCNSNSPCTYDTGSSTCGSTGVCSGTWTIRRDWSIMSGVF